MTMFTPAFKNILRSEIFDEEMKYAMLFQSFARYYARQCLWEIIPYLACYTIAEPPGRGIEARVLSISSPAKSMEEVLQS